MSNLKDKYLHKVIKLYIEGKSTKEIAQQWKLSTTTIRNWKKECRGTSLDWDCTNPQKINSEEWFNSSLQKLLIWVGQNPEEWTEDRLKILNNFLSAKKKNDGERDILTETSRVLKDLARFIKEYYPNKTEDLEEILMQFMHYQQDN